MIISDKKYIVEIDYILEREFESFDTLEEAEEFMDEMESLDPVLYIMY